MPNPYEHMDLEKERERICAECDHFTFRRRDPGDRAQGWAYCRRWKRWFPRQGGILDLTGKVNKIMWDPAGKRTCKEWK